MVVRRSTRVGTGQRSPAARSTSCLRMQTLASRLMGIVGSALIAGRETERRKCFLNSSNRTVNVQTSQITMSAFMSMYDPFYGRLTSTHRA